MLYADLTQAHNVTEEFFDVAVKLELNKELVQKAIYMAINSNKRMAMKHGTNPLIKDIIDKENATLQNAMNTMSETK